LALPQSARSARGFRQIDASLQKAWKLHESHELMFVSDFYNVANITSYNNQGRTVDGGSTWGLYRVRAPSHVRSTWS
jgi:hypothetical protein